jgi:hypothetical protein
MPVQNTQTGFQRKYTKQAKTQWDHASILDYSHPVSLSKTQELNKFVVLPSGSSAHVAKSF